MKEKATFAAGCFWHVQEAFEKVEGIVKTTAGYSGGRMKNPTYEDVCSGETGHAEAVQVEFNPKKVSYRKLLEVFWQIHDPTQLNRQGHDVGEQYRSVIFCHNAKQKKMAEESRKAEQKKYSNLITTQILPAPEFYPAEEYHQHYYRKHKILGLRKMFRCA